MRVNAFLISAGLVFVLATSVAAEKDDIQYFSNEIDYWDEGQPKDATPSPTPSSGPQAEEAKPTFDWNRYLDPKNKEFFQEGNYTPPDPFMEVVRDPNDRNLSMWFSYLNKKNELATRLQKRMQAYLSEHGSTWSPVTKQAFTQAQPTPVSLSDTQRFRFRMYFDSTCPHCAQMFDTLKNLQERGYFVEARQVDTGTFKNPPIAISRASREEIRKQHVDTVPFLLIGDLKTQKVYTLIGYQTPEDIFRAIQQQGAL